MEAEQHSLKQFDAYRRKCLRNIGVFSIMVNLLMLVLPLYSLQVFSRVLSSRSEETLLLLSAIALALLLLQSVLEFIRKRMLGFVANAYDTYLSQALVAESLHSESVKPDSGRIYINKMNEARSGYSSPFLLVLFDLPWTPFFVFVVYLIEPLLGWYALGSVLLLVTLGALNGLLVKSKQKGLLDATSAHRGALQTLLASSKEINWNGWSESKATTWQQKTDKLNQEQDGFSLSQIGFQSFIKTLRQLLQIGILALGAWLVITDQAIPGVLLAGSILLGRVLAPIDQGINQWQAWSQSRKAILTVRQLLKSKPKEDKVVAQASKDANLVFEAFSMKDAHNRMLLQSIQFDLKPKQCLLVQGPTGAGKSVLLESVISSNHQTSGKIKVNGSNVAEWSGHVKAQVFGYLPPSPTVIDGSVFSNITGGEASPEALQRCVEICKKLGLHPTINALPQSYETELGTHGPQLSDGTKKMLGLARVMFRDPPILLLDQPETHIGPQNIAELAEVLKDLYQEGRSIIMASNEPQLTQIADWVIFLDKGKIVKAGRLKDEKQNVSPIRGA